MANLLVCILDLSFCRSSFASSGTVNKKKALAEGEDTEEDLEEPKVILFTKWTQITSVFHSGICRHGVCQFFSKLFKLLST